MINIQDITQRIGELVLSYAPSVFGALVVLVVGWTAIGYFKKYLGRFFGRVDFDQALETFLLSFLSIVLKVILVVIVVSMLGVQTTSLVAVLGAASLAVGLALQGSLSNFAGGVLILIFKPFGVGDYIQAQGVEGSVTSIQIFNTILSSLDNKKIVLPNGILSNGVIVNVTFAKKRRIDLVLGIGYEADIKHAKEVIEQTLKKTKGIIQDDGFTIGVGNLGESSVDLDVRFWVPTEEYLTVKHQFTEAIKLAFDEQKISIPYPQIDVHSK